MSEQKTVFLERRLLIDANTPLSQEDVGETSSPEFAGKVVVSNLTCQVNAGSLTVIVGMTGAGKSSILQGILLGEVIMPTLSIHFNKPKPNLNLTTQGQLLSGQATITGSISYVSQTAWIQNATLRDNILFGNKFVENRYEAVLFACALDMDLKLLPLGDMTEIGEKGVNLSGGQQQRYLRHIQ